LFTKQKIGRPSKSSQSRLSRRKKVKDFNTFINEVKILKALDHPNIIKLYEIWEWNEVCFLVLEYCEGGELF